jgi:hypothetical protein
MAHLYANCIILRISSDHRSIPHRRAMPCLACQRDWCARRLLPRPRCPCRDSIVSVRPPVANNVAGYACSGTNAMLWLVVEGRARASVSQAWGRCPSALEIASGLMMAAARWPRFGAGERLVLAADGGGSDGILVRCHRRSDESPPVHTPTDNHTPCASTLSTLDVYGAMIAEPLPAMIDLFSRSALDGRWVDLRHHHRCLRTVVQVVSPEQRADLRSDLGG